MSQIKFDKPLKVNLVFSLQHKIFLCLIHSVAIVLLLFPFDLHIGIKLIFVVYVIYSFIFIYNRTRNNYTGYLNYVEENLWFWVNSSSEYELKFRHGIILSPRMVLLTFSDKKRKNCYWVLFPDSVEKDIFRKIRILVCHSTAETISPPV